MSKCQNKLIYMLQNILDLMSCFPGYLKKRKRSDLVCQLYTDKLEGNVDSILQWYAKKNLYSLVLKKKKGYIIHKCFWVACDNHKFWVPILWHNKMCRLEGKWLKKIWGKWSVQNKKMLKKECYW